MSQSPDQVDKVLDVERSRAIAQVIKSKAKAPFENAYKAALELGDEVFYVQGFLVFPGTPFKPIEHSWLELAERRIDPSYPHFNRQPETLYYFPAQTLSLTELKEAIAEAQEDYPEDEPLPIYGSMPYEYYGDVMLGGKAYQTAYEAAQAHCQALNRPSKKVH
ncbi:MAG: hypothetical protein VKJ24_14465 [Synechococcales bacterium]|nr:hypothetical protein [Synechococcales bacterium]